MQNSQVSSKPRRLLLPRLLAQRNTFSAEEVRRRLRMDEPGDPRTAAVHAAASQTGVWSSLLPDRLAFDLGRTASRLPTIVYWYSQGVSTEEIGQRISLFGSTWDAERALDVAASLIALALNRGHFAAQAA